MASLSVADRGIGIPAQQQARIFGRFERADNGRAYGIGGTGLGLYLSRALVEQHGGRIWFEISRGRGLDLLRSPSTFLRIHVGPSVKCFLSQHCRDAMFLSHLPVRCGRCTFSHFGFRCSSKTFSCSSLGRLPLVEDRAVFISCESWIHSYGFSLTPSLSCRCESRVTL